MKKILNILLILLFITGCNKSTDDIEKIDRVIYNLNITDMYNEEIIAIFSANAYQIADKSLETDIPPLEYILLYDDQYPIVSNFNKKYQKEIIKNDANIKVYLSYSFTEDDYINATYLHNCFENYEIISTDSDFEINLSDGFYCLHDKEFIINVTSNYSVISSNGIQKGNKYTWTINEDNYNKINIHHKIRRNIGNMQDEYITKINTSNEDNNIRYYVILIISIIAIVGIITMNIIFTSKRGQK